MIQYKIHDATIPLFQRTMIVHICNNVNIWQHGFVVPLAQKYPQAKAIYHQVPQTLEHVQFVLINDNLIIANMIAQNGILTAQNPKPLDMDALKTTLEKVYHHAHLHHFNIQMPKIGSGLAGGNWEEIAPLITYFSQYYHVETIICEL